VQPTIKKNSIVTIDYQLRKGDGTALDRSEPGDPMVYLHGADNLVPGLERALEGKTVGEHLNVVVAPEDGYGPKRKTKPQPVLRSDFPKDAHVEVGVSFVTEGPDGKATPIWITKIQGKTVYVDTNHPLAGETLHFEVEIKAIREATEEELAHGHPHGPDGHHHH
jgi:FKBP-type peptidyl-prolyl cis-trans isomerase SlyD